MLIDKWKVGGEHAWESYAQCIDQVIKNEYSKVENRPYYIRKDLDIDFDPNSEFQ